MSDMLPREAEASIKQLDKPKGKRIRKTKPRDEFIDWANPRYDDVKDVEQGRLNEAASNYDGKAGERRLTLLAMTLMEACLRDTAGWNKKERFDAATRCLQLIKGSKVSLFTEDAEAKDLPKDAKEMERKKVELAGRIQELLATQAANSAKGKKVMDDALDVLGEDNDGECN